MKAMIYEKYGNADVLKMKDIEKPTPKDDEVLIKVCAVSINDWDWQLLLGIPFANKMMNGFIKPKRQVLGSDVAGIIEAVGKDVTKFKIGDEVFGDLSGEWGGFAEYVCAKENFVELKLKSMTFEEAAAIPQAGMLAVQGLCDVGKIKAGQKILINGAGGGVGTFAIQIAKLYDGVEVTGVDSKEKLDMLRQMGFDNVIDYKKEDFTKNGKRYDLILDAKTNRSPFHYTRALAPNGIYATVGGSIFRILQIFIFGSLISKITKKSLNVVILKQNKDLVYMNELFLDGKMKPVIDGPYKFDELPKAFRIFGRGEHKGKMVVTI